MIVIPLLRRRYYAPTPNGWKISIFLEEAGIPYNLIPVDLARGDQFAPSFLALSPNNRMPAILDRAPPGGGPPVSVFESGAILLYLARKAGKFYPPAGDAHLRARTEARRPPSPSRRHGAGASGFTFRRVC